MCWRQRLDLQNLSTLAPEPTLDMTVEVAPDSSSPLGGQMMKVHTSDWIGVTASPFPDDGAPT